MKLYLPPQPVDCFLRTSKLIACLALFAVHIMFDDAFELSDENDDYQEANRFVKRFVQVIDTAASYVHQCEIKLHPPIKYPTPYGGQLEYTLPGGNKLYVHMKDKLKIRHRKRWSQVSTIGGLFILITINLSSCW